MKILFLFLFICVSFTHAEDEASLLKACGQQDLVSCERLGTYYIAQKNWDKAYLLGEALCGKEQTIGCTYAGTSLLAKGKIKEGHQFLIKACDKFEPFACRSLARLMSKAEEKNLAHMYFKRACYYGLQEVCSELTKGRTIFSPAATDYLKKIQEDCLDTKASACSDRLNLLQTCAKPLSTEDCQLIPGFLSILFRAKLIQAEAKFSLNTLLASQKKLKAYSHDIEVVLKDYKPLARYHYVFGFMKACSKGKTLSNELFAKSYHYGPRATSAIRSYFGKGKQSDCYTVGGFEAFAVANLDPMNPSRVDVWKINHDGNLIHVQDGLPQP